MTRYSAGLVLAWSVGAGEALAGNAIEIAPAHLLVGLCGLATADTTGLVYQLRQPNDRVEAMGDARELASRFDRAALDPVRLRRHLQNLIRLPGAAQRPNEVLHRSTQSRRLFGRAEELATRGGSEVVRAHHLLLVTLAMRDAPWSKLLAELGCADPLAAMVNEAGERMPDALKVTQPAVAHSLPRSTPMLDQVGRDLTALARAGELSPVFGRDAEQRELIRILLQQRRSNVILVGEAGVGKTCLVEGLAIRLLSPDTPASLRTKRIVGIAMNDLVAGTIYRGQFEAQMKQLLDEAAADTELVLFIDEIHTVLGAGSAGGMALDAANILKPMLARGDVTLIGATTTSEYRAYVEQDPAFARRFEVMFVAEPSREAAVEIVRGVRPAMERHHGVTVTDAAIEAAVDLTRRYLPDLRLPDKAIDVIDQACAALRIATLTTDVDLTDRQYVDREAVAHVVSQRARVPVERMTRPVAERLLDMEEQLRRRVVGQDLALTAVSQAVRTAAAGLKPPNRPIGAFLFVGNSGTGKTELAKAIAEFLFDDERALIRIDMSELMERHAVARLIGAPPGYQDSEQEGQLTGRVRSNPHSVVLFDEIEKAHPQVLDLLLQILDEGQLTDARGRAVSFADTLIVMTSNLGTTGDVRAAPKPLGLVAQHEPEPVERQSLYERRLRDAVRQTLRPELINRLTIVLFAPLDRSSLRAVVDKMLRMLHERLKEQGITLLLTPEAYEVLFEQGFDDRFGAREMERVAHRMIVEPLSRALLEGRVTGPARLLIDASGRELTIEPDGERTRRIEVETFSQTGLPSSLKNETRER